MQWIALLFALVASAAGAQDWPSRPAHIVVPYTPGTGDEGSVTVTQVQALRAARNAGFLVPRAVVTVMDPLVAPTGT